MKFLYGLLANLHTILFLLGVFLICLAVFLYQIILGILITGIFLVVIGFILKSDN